MILLQAKVDLPLRNIHVTQSIPWWPIATGWWLLLAAVALVAIALHYGWRQQRRRRQRVLDYFEDYVGQGATVPAQIARISELLRRAGRTKNPEADRLEGDDWLQFLNRGMKHAPFQGRTGELLLTGGFRPAVPSAAFDALKEASARRFAKWVREV